MEFHGGMTVMEYGLGAHYSSKAVGEPCDEDSKEYGLASG